MATENYVFGAFITNLEKYTEGELVGEWVGFPTTYEHLEKVMNKIGKSFSNVELVTDYDSKIGGMFELIGEYVNLDELNYLANKLKELSDTDLKNYEAALEYESFDNIQSLINLTDNLKNYPYYPEVTSEEDLGRYIIDKSRVIDVGEDIIAYFDFEAYGRDVSINEGGMFTKNGYISGPNGTFTEYYDGKKENIPSEYRVTSEHEQSDKTQNIESEKSNRPPMLGISR